MKNFDTISPQENIPKKSPSIPESKLTRRDFLKGVGATSLLGAAGALGIKSFDSENPIDESNNTEALTEAEQKKIDDAIAKILDKTMQPTPEQITLDIQNKDVIGKTFYEQLLVNDEISLNESTKKAIYDMWHEIYSPGGKEYEGSLLRGLERMKPWLTEIKSVFREYEVPEKYLYLAIPESHFNVDAISKAEDPAIGPYQITSSTANLPISTLQVSDTYDERRDPIESARLCAKHLQYSYDAFDNDWDLALMDYNGSFTNSYIKHVLKEEETMPIILQKIDADSDEILTDKLLSGQTLSEIAAKHETSVELLKRANDIATEDIRKLKSGLILKIPQKREISIEGFNTWLETNINNEISNAQTHIVISGDTLSNIAKKTKTNQRDIELLNNLTSTELSIGQELQIPKQKTKKDAVIFKLQTIAKYSENINYPEKFNAIFDVIESHGLNSSIDALKIIYQYIDIPKTSLTTFQYKVKSGDSLSKIIRSLKQIYPNCTETNTLLQQKFVKQNDLPNASSIRENQILSIDININKPPTLLNIAKQYDVDIKLLQFLNPAVLKINQRLSSQCKIRLPKQKSS